MNKLTKKIIITVKTGLHIGSGNDHIQIGGVDSAVIKDPKSKLPYIPGSSIKGKIRCLLETEGNYGENHDVVNMCFGANVTYLRKKGKDFPQTPTRFIFRDLFLSEKDKIGFEKGDIETEFKTEILVDRIKGTAKDGGLRTIERVPPGVVFSGDVLIRYSDDNEKDEIVRLLGQGVELLNNDYLGGSGSRGYGAVYVQLN